MTISHQEDKFLQKRGGLVSYFTNHQEREGRQGRKRGRKRGFDELIGITTHKKYPVN